MSTSTYRDMKSGQVRRDRLLCCVQGRRWQDGAIGRSGRSRCSGTGQPVLLVHADRRARHSLGASGPRRQAHHCHARPVDPVDEPRQPVGCHGHEPLRPGRHRRPSGLGGDRQQRPGSGRCRHPAHQANDERLTRLWPTWEAAEKAGTPALVVLNMVRLGMKSLDVARSALEAGGATLPGGLYPSERDRPSVRACADRFPGDGCG